MTNESFPDTALAGIAQGARHGSDAFGHFLRVTRDGVMGSLIPGAPSEIECGVAVDGSRDDIDPLDHMTIIRPAGARV